MGYKGNQVDKYTITRWRLARPKLATGPGTAWRWMYNAHRGGAIVVRGFDRLDSLVGWIKRDAKKNSIVTPLIVKDWELKETV